MSLGHQRKPSTSLREDMDNHRRPRGAFDELEDADVVLAQPVVADELDPAAAVEASGVARVVVPDAPPLFSSLFGLSSRTSCDLPSRCSAANPWWTICIAKKEKK